MNIILQNPEIPHNTGNIIRLCQNTHSKLHLIKPLGFNLQNKNLKRAHLDYLEPDSIKIHNSFEYFLESYKPKRLIAVDTSGISIYSSFEFSRNDSLIFGCESKGLPKRVFNHKSITHSVRIPMNSSSRSINLSNSVSIVLYEALKQLNFPRMK